MPKYRTNSPLPARLHKKHGGYFYVYPHDGKNVWRNLGRDEAVAIKLAKDLNELERKKRIEVFGIDRDATKRIYDKVMLRDGYKCIYCGTDKDLGLDHVLPYVKGGSSEPFNLVACCMSCNFRKGDENPLIFMLRKEGFFEQLLTNILFSIRQN